LQDSHHPLHSLYHPQLPLNPSPYFRSKSKKRSISKKQRNPLQGLLQRLSNRKKKIGNKKKGLLRRLNMIGGYSRRLLGMRVLPFPRLLLQLPLQVRMVEEKEREEEVDRGKCPIVGPLMLRRWSEFLLRLGLMMSL
jgi:hypothetical protein